MLTSSSQKLKKNTFYQIWEKYDSSCKRQFSGSKRRQKQDQSLRLTMLLSILTRDLRFLERYRRNYIADVQLIFVEYGNKWGRTVTFHYNLSKECYVSPFTWDPQITAHLHNHFPRVKPTEFLFSLGPCSLLCHSSLVNTI